MALSSFGQMYCCLRRPLHFACSRLKEMADEGCPAENSFTGIETNPKEMVPDAMDRALMGPDDNLQIEMPNFLDEYRRKRSPERTPEPFGGGSTRPGIFVVQKHSATRI